MNLINNVRKNRKVRTILKVLTVVYVMIVIIYIINLKGTEETKTSNVSIENNYSNNLNDSDTNISSYIEELTNENIIVTEKNNNKISENNVDINEDLDKEDETKQTNNKTKQEKSSSSNSSNTTNKTIKTTTNKNTDMAKENKEDTKKESTKDDDISKKEENTDNITFLSQPAKDMFDLLNDYRKENNLNALKWNDDIEYYSKVRAKEIAQNFSHTRPDGNTILEVGIVYGENIGYSSFSKASIMFDKFKTSSAHNKNLLNKNYKSVAIVCMYSEEKQEYYWVQLFGM